MSNMTAVNPKLAVDSTKPQLNHRSRRISIEKTGIGVENNANIFASGRNNNSQEIEAKYTKVIFHVWIQN